MQLVFSFSTLLASLVVALSLVNDVQARPVAARGAGMTTLPLKRITHGARSDVHPQIVSIVYATNIPRAV